MQNLRKNDKSKLKPCQTYRKPMNFNKNLLKRKLCHFEWFLSKSMPKQKQQIGVPGRTLGAQG